MSLEPPPKIVKEFTHHWVDWLWYLYEDTRPTGFIAPASIDAVTLIGTLTGTVSDVQSLNDGNVLIVNEVSGAPGILCDMEFSNVSTIRGIVFKGYYSGSASHWVEIQLYNYITTTWDIFMTFSDGNGMNYRYIEIPDGSPYISDGNSIMRAYHPSAGTPTHDLFIDYVALLSGN